MLFNAIYNLSDVTTAAYNYKEGAVCELHLAASRRPPSSQPLPKRYLV